MKLTITGQSTFNTYYYTGYSNVGSNNVISQSDSNIVFCNYIRDTITHIQNLGLIKLDNHGNEIIKKKYNLFGYDIGAFIQAPNNFLQISKSYFLLLGAITNTNSKTAVIILKVNYQTLDTVKTLLISDSGNNLYLNNIIKLTSNKFIVAGSKSQNFNSSTQNPIIFQIDSSLNVISGSVNIANPNNFWASNIILNPVTKKILMAGITSVTHGPNQPLTLMHTDTLGNLNQIVSIATSSLPNYPVTFRYSAIDTSYVAVGGANTSTYGPNQYLQRMTISKFNAITLQPKWQFYYGDESAVNSFGVSYIDDDGSIVCSAQYAPYSTLPLFNEDVRGAIVKVDKNGQVLWARDYNNLITGPNPHSYWEGFFGIDKTLDKGYIAVGAVIGQPNGKAWAVKTDSMGCVNATNCPSFNFTAVPFSVSFSTLAIPTSTTNTNTVSIKDYSQNKLSIYPNPIQTILNIEFENNFNNQNYTLKIVDVLGRTFSTFSLVTSNKISVDLSKLPNGIYFLQVWENDQLISTKKFLKE